MQKLITRRKLQLTTAAASLLLIGAGAAAAASSQTPLTRPDGGQPTGSRLGTSITSTAGPVKGTPKSETLDSQDARAPKQSESRRRVNTNTTYLEAGPSDQAAAASGQPAETPDTYDRDSGTPDTNTNTTDCGSIGDDGTIWRCQTNETSETSGAYKPYVGVSGTNTDSNTTYCGSPGNDDGSVVTC
jgi:hypothetical protein